MANIHHNKFSKKKRRSFRSDDQSHDSTSFSLDSQSAIKDFLRLDPSAVTELRLKENFMTLDRSDIKEIIALAKKAKIKITAISKDHPDTSGVQASVTVKASEVEFDENFLEANHQIIVALDHILDPRNVGAIVRSCAFFGANLIILPKDRQAGISQAALSTSMAGFAVVKAAVVTNLNRTLQELKDLGYVILGADSNGMELSQCQISAPIRLVVVLGSEEHGLSRLIKEKCDELVGIKSAAAPNIDSLNVSVAAGVLLSQLAAIIRR